VRSAGWSRRPWTRGVRAGARGVVWRVVRRAWGWARGSPRRGWAPP